MQKNESPNAKPKKLMLNQETLANLREGTNLMPPTRSPTNPPGCSGHTWRCW